MSDFRVCAVLPASGTGERMSADTPKQYSNIVGKPLFLYTVEAFESAKWIEKIALVVAKDHLQSVQSILEENGNTRTIVVEGSYARHRSIRNGVRALRDSQPDVVIIHDVVRPFVKEEILRSVAEAAFEHGAAGVIKPLVSTVIAQNEAGFLDHSLDRSKYRASEMPQAFQYSAINSAYNKCNTSELDYGTECLHLAQKYEHVAAKLIDTSDDLWKVTYPKDLYAAEGIIKHSLTNTAVLTTEENNGITQDFIKHAGNRLQKVQHFTKLDDIPKELHKSVVTFSQTDQTVSLTTEYGKLVHSCGIIVHVYETRNLRADETVDILETIQRVAEVVNHVIVNAIIIKEGYTIEATAKLASNLIMDRKMEYSGQVFFC